MRFKEGDIITINFYNNSEYRYYLGHNIAQELNSKINYYILKYSYYDLITDIFREIE